MALTLSVVVPARDAGPTVAGSVASVLDEAARTDHVEVSVVVVDDGSDDGTAERATRAGAHAVIRRDTSGGPGAARNTGVAATAGELVAFLDADDVWVPGRLAALLASLTDDSVAAAVGACRFVGLPDAERADLGWSGDGEPEAVVPSLGAAVFRRSALDAVGPLDEARASHEDHDLFLRLGDAGLAVATVRSVVTEVRARPDSLSRLTEGSAAAQRAVLAASVRRRRTAGATSTPVLRPRWGPLGPDEGAGP